MQMSLSQYIINPMGRNNAVLNATARESIRANYKKRYDALMLREHGNLKYTLYEDKTNNVFVAHFKVPSETVNDFYYDVVFEFSTNSDVESAGTDLFKYNCRYFSNDPSFVYTYAYVFNHDDLLIDQLKSKMSKKALNKRAGEKNPGNNIGYVKTIYFAYLYMQSRSLNKVDLFRGVAQGMSKRNLRSDVMDADTKIQKRQDAGEKLKAQEQKNKRRAEKIMQNKPEMAKINRTIGNKSIGRMGNVNTIPKMKKILPRRSNKK